MEKELISWENSNFFVDRHVPMGVHRYIYQYCSGKVAHDCRVHFACVLVA